MTREEYKDRVIELIDNKCKKGKHSFQKIFETGDDKESTVVRWCEVCGSIVVDEDYDGRTKPGAVMGMLSPSITKVFN